MQSQTTLTLPQHSEPRRVQSGKFNSASNKFGNKSDRPRPPAGHQSDLTKYKQKANVRIYFMDRDDPMVGRLINADRYTITVRVGPSDHVCFKHAIATYVIVADEVSNA